jgi:MFS family permease
MIQKDSILRDRKLYLVFSISLISTLGVSTVSPAFPKIMAALKISEAEVGMLITAFSIPDVILAPFIGVLGAPAPAGPKKSDRPQPVPVRNSRVCLHVYQ